jgi:hypothetical protein
MRLTITVLLASLVGIAPVRANEASRERGLIYRDGHLSGELDGVPLEYALALIASETGADIRGSALDSRPIYKHFDRVPLPEALRRLLGRQNFTLRYDAVGKPTAIELGGTSLPPPAKKAVPARRSRPTYPHVRNPPARRAPVLGRRAGAGVMSASRR